MLCFFLIDHLAEFTIDLKGERNSAISIEDHIANSTFDHGQSGVFDPTTQDSSSQK
jgi:hypothetical protein